jgi:competence protein ComEC
MIFTGDIEKEAEYILKDKDIGSTVLKVPHHGSFTSSSREFIEKVSPKVSLITVGKNFYGHPSKQTLENIQEAGSTIYRTDINGAIEIITNGLKLELTSVR